MNPFNVSPDVVLNVEGHLFFARIPTPRGRIAIDVMVAEYLRGQSLQSIPADTYDFARMIATLNTVIYKKPPEFEEVKDWGQHYDVEFVAAVWGQYNEKEEEFLAKLKKNKSPGLAEERGSNLGPIRDVQVSEDSAAAGNVPSSKNASSGSGRVDGELGFPENASAGHPASPRARVRTERPA
jgi:hypothetical protein